MVSVGMECDMHRVDLHVAIVDVIYIFVAAQVEQARTDPGGAGVLVYGLAKPSKPLDPSLACFEILSE